MDTQEKARSHRLRLGRSSESDRFYLLTTVTQKREPIFADTRAARTLIHILSRQQEMGKVVSHAFVVMPDHLHWLVQLQNDQLNLLMGRVKSISARQIGALRWQAGFHDHALRREEDIKKIARYIIANPLRAGLVDSVGDYPHWDAIWL
ncbi:REP-associated tyrosine transposase [Halopseudomonas pelagia]|uniref:Transposase n=1 Tax=Halopseudomonas pelagia TaxID=553151 RepID=A0AA91TYQ8_9GAMM|nr:transposase [Halopseudomonas pelagia]PCC97424.1 transposase [Halopseudomonas pelagia]QFY57739.1 transposase [Halopseudomonas pelagia]